LDLLKRILYDLMKSGSGEEYAEDDSLMKIWREESARDFDVVTDSEVDRPGSSW
jgi:hypothetical protein